MLSRCDRVRQCSARSGGGDQVTAKIHKILRPFEYTRIDDIVDIVFTTAEDKEGGAGSARNRRYKGLHRPSSWRAQPLNRGAFAQVVQ